MNPVKEGKVMHDFTIEFDGLKDQCVYMEPEDYPKLEIPICFLKWLARNNFKAKAWKELTKHLTRIFKSGGFGAPGMSVREEVEEFNTFGLSDFALIRLFFPYICMSVFSDNVLSTFVSDFILDDDEKVDFLSFYKLIKKA